jgi:hypothetical protein
MKGIMYDLSCEFLYKALKTKKIHMELQNK